MLGISVARMPTCSRFADDIPKTASDSISRKGKEFRSTDESAIARRFPEGGDLPSEPLLQAQRDSFSPCFNRLSEAFALSKTIFMTTELA